MCLLPRFLHERSQDSESMRCTNKGKALNRKVALGQVVLEALVLVLERPALAFPPKETVQGLKF